MQDAPPPDVVKCDVEGAEMEVLEGGRSLLTHFKPVIVCEAHSELGAERVRELLVHAGYTIRWIHDNHLLALPSLCHLGPLV